MFSFYINYLGFLENEAYLFHLTFYISKNITRSYEEPKFETETKV